MLIPVYLSSHELYFPSLSSKDLFFVLIFSRFASSYISLRIFFWLSILLWLSSRATAVSFFSVLIFFTHLFGELFSAHISFESSLWLDYSSLTLSSVLILLCFDSPLLWLSYIPFLVNFLFPDSFTLTLLCFDSAILSSESNLVRLSSALTLLFSLLNLTSSALMAFLPGLNFSPDSVLLASDSPTFCSNSTLMLSSYSGFLSCTLLVILSSAPSSISIWFCFPVPSFAHPTCPASWHLSASAFHCLSAKWV